MKQGKVWGDTEEIYNNGIVSVNFLRIRKGGFCSEHRHIKKNNLFFVISGSLRIEIWMDGARDETMVCAGQTTRIGPGNYHRFLALTDVDCLEIYDLKLDDGDIERRTAGGAG